MRLLIKLKKQINYSIITNKEYLCKTLFILLWKKRNNGQNEISASTVFFTVSLWAGWLFVHVIYLHNGALFVSL